MSCGDVFNSSSFTDLEQKFESHTVVAQFAEIDPRPSYIHSLTLPQFAPQWNSLAFHISSFPAKFHISSFLAFTWVFASDVSASEILLMANVHISCLYPPEPILCSQPVFSLQHSDPEEVVPAESEI